MPVTLVAGEDSPIGTMTHSDKELAPEAILAEMSWLRRLARSLVRDESAADDVAQETWLAALYGRPAGLENDGLRSWLATVARNVVRRRHRDEATRRRYEEASAEALPTSTTDEVERLRLQHLIAEHVLSLREPYRTAVLMR